MNSFDEVFEHVKRYCLEKGQIPEVAVKLWIDALHPVDLSGTDATIGYDTALNTIMEAVDRLRDTATSHERLFFVEVMGHKVGWLTLYAGVASGADIILLPEIPYDIDKVIEAIDKSCLLYTSDAADE